MSELFREKLISNTTKHRNLLISRTREAKREVSNDRCYKVDIPFDERRVLAFKSKIEQLEVHNRRLRKELNAKDNAFAKCADLCAFFSKILSNEYVTVERKNGFRVPLGKSLINTSVSHMKFEWAPEEEEFLEDELYF